MRRRVGDALRRLLSTVRRARTVRESLRFVVGEYRPRPTTARYRLRESGVEVTLRHRTPDVYALDQAFYQRHFDFPPPVEELLARRPGDSVKVVDLGANIGLFGAYVLGRIPAATVTAFEPDPSNVEILSRTAASNGAARWQVVEACAATEDGEVGFEAGQFGVSRVAEGPGGGALTVAAQDVFPYLEDADVIKIDIEGSEWAILTDPRFASLTADAIHMEYHGRMCPAPDPEAFATRLLEEAGYEVRPQVQTSPTEGILWAWRR